METDVEKGHIEINELPQIFVFGSNLLGIHGSGAALYARENKGAVLGVGEGLRGNSYALPTCSAPGKPLDLKTIEFHVDRFILFARLAGEMEFIVTRVGCGLAGYTDQQIAPMFGGAPTNCLFDTKWGMLLPTKRPEYRFWGTV